MTLLIVYAVLSIFFSFLCSILEAALLSFTPTYLRMKTQEGKTYAKTLTNFKKDIDKPLIAILTLNYQVVYLTILLTLKCMTLVVELLIVSKMH